MIDISYTRLKRILKTQGGFTLAETLFAGVVMIGAIITVVSLLEAAVSTLTMTNERSVANQVANEQIENARNLDYEQLQSTGAPPSSAEDPDLVWGSPASYKDIAADGAAVYRSVNYDSSVGLPMQQSVDRKSGYFRVFTYVVWVADGSNPQAYKRVIVKVTWQKPTKGEIVMASGFAKEDSQEPRPSVAVRGVISSNLNYFTGVTQNMVLGSEDSVRGNITLRATAKNNSGKSTGITKVIANLYSPAGALKASATDTAPDGDGYYTFGFDVGSSTSYPDSEGYTFVVDAFDSIGGTQRDSMRVAIDNTAPAAVINLNASAVPNSAMQNVITWDWVATPGDGIPKVSRFILQRKQSGGSYAQIAALPNEADIFVDSGLAPATAYVYRMIAVDGAGNWMASIEKDRSSTGKVRTDFLAPAVPANVTAAPVAWNAVDIKWDASVDEAGGSGLSGYYLVASDGSGTTVVGYAMAPTSFTPEYYQDYGLKGSATYTYKVSAYDLEGNISAQSTGASVTTPLR